LQGRNSFRGNEPLVSLWREVSKPRRGGAIKAQPAGCKVDFDSLFNKWLEARGLTATLKRMEDKEGWAVFAYAPEEAVVRSKPGWEKAYHGTWWYAVWLILKSGIFLESNDRSLGHDYWEPGVYCSPSLDTGLWYARPQILFGDGVYHRVIFELRVDPEQRKRDRKRGGVQWVFPSSAVALHAVWVRSNAPPKNGEERVNEWDPELEAFPPGCHAVEPVVNSRTDPWPDMEDDFPFDPEGNSDVPPWMQSPKSHDIRIEPNALAVCGAKANAGIFSHMTEANAVLAMLSQGCTQGVGGAVQPASFWSSSATWSQFPTAGAWGSWGTPGCAAASWCTADTWWPSAWERPLAPGLQPRRWAKRKGHDNGPILPVAAKRQLLGAGGTAGSCEAGCNSWVPALPYS